MGDFEPGFGAGIGQAQHLPPECQASMHRRLAGDEGLARGRGLAAIGRQIGIGGDQIDQCQRQADGIGGDLGDDRVRALPDIDRALMQRQAAIGLEAEADGRGIGQRGIAAAIEHAGDANATAQDAAALVEAAGACTGLAPGRPQRLEAFADADAVAHHLAGHSRG